MGELQVPADALWGAQTQRAVENFPISGLPMPRGFLRALGLVKAAAAEVNAGLGLLPQAQAAAIRKAALAVAEGAHDAHFPIDVFQTGSGTSSNMNANEVIATLASRARQAGASQRPRQPRPEFQRRDPDRDPRLGAAGGGRTSCCRRCMHLRRTIDRRGRSLDRMIKTGRTHLMDAMPLTFGQEFGAGRRSWRPRTRASTTRCSALRRLPLGGTAIGTGINADPRFGKAMAKALSTLSGTKFESADNQFEGIASQDDAVELSGQLNALAVALMKIANDLRWMNSGPLAGLGEIELPALQPGSSIMPGKVNPVIPEALCMVCAQVIGNHATITDRRRQRQLPAQRDAAGDRQQPAGVDRTARERDAAARRQGDRRLQGAARPRRRGAGAQSDPGDRAQSGDRLREGGGDRQARVHGRAAGARRRAGR